MVGECNQVSPIAASIPEGSGSFNQELNVLICYLTYR